MSSETAPRMPERSTHNRRDAAAARAAPERGTIPPPPRGRERLAWLGPAFLWMVSAAGSGELLFTPRIAARYGYLLLWALLASVLLKWFINREVGRFAVCTGAPILEGFRRLPGPRNWAVWIIIVPQLLVAVSVIAGLAGAAATAAALLFPGSVKVWSLVLLLGSAALVVRGGYSGLERMATWLALVLATAAVAGAAVTFPGVGPLASGLVPGLPPSTDYSEILPWLGFMLAGAVGMMWYSYWLPQRGYGAAGSRLENRDDRTQEEGTEAQDEGARFFDPVQAAPEEQERLRGWIGQLAVDNTVAVVGTLIPTVAFLILGTELLRPQGLVPEEDQVAGTLGHLLGAVWGPAGFWFMVTGLLIGFTGTLLTNQDGFGRLFAHGTEILLRPLNLEERWYDRAFLHRSYVLVLVTLLPMAVYLAVGEPVTLLKIAGAIDAAHIPVLTGLTLYLNRRLLPDSLRPSWPVLAVTGLAGLFFAGFAVLYVLYLVGWGGPLRPGD